MGLDDLSNIAKAGGPWAGLAVIAVAVVKAWPRLRALAQRSETTATQEWRKLYKEVREELDIANRERRELHAALGRVEGELEACETRARSQRAEIDAAHERIAEHAAELRQFRLRLEGG